MDEVDGQPGEKKSRRFTFLLVGVVLGVLGTVFLPSLVTPYLPSALRGADTEVQGSVFKKLLEDGEKPRLLLSVDTEQGAVLATFNRQVAEIDMLVDEGDQVTLGVSAYAPFVSDPVVAGVRKGSGETEPAATSAKPQPLPVEEMMPDTTETTAAEAGASEPEAADADSSATTSEGAATAEQDTAGTAEAEPGGR